MREKCLIISKLCVDLTFYITLCCVVACLFCVKTARKRDKLVKRAREQAEEEEKGKF